MQSTMKIRIMSETIENKQQKTRRVENQTWKTHTNNI